MNKYCSIDYSEPKLERVPCPKWVIAVLSFVASASFVVLFHSTAGNTALYSNTLPKLAGLKATFGLVSERSTPAIQNGIPLSLPERQGEVVAHFGHNSDSTWQSSRTGVAGISFGAVVATVVSLFNRYRVKRADGALASASGTALLDPPATRTTEETFNNKGIVTPEEGVNLPFTMAELREAIPKECFDKSLGWSMFYFARDWAIVAMMYYFQPQFFGLGVVGKFLWWNIVGFYGWCLFVVGHDCGHGSFSNYGWLNQILGHVCHAPLCVPFNGWRISHRHHHQYHNDVDRDHSWRPSLAEDVNKLPSLLKAVRFTPFILLAYPYYLLSPSQENGFSGNHFWPWNPLFKEEERAGIAASALSVFAWLGVIAAATMKFGFSTVFQLYWIPYLIFVAWLDLVTMLQHTDKNALFFRGEAWTYLRGAMSTIDRTYRHLIDPFNLGYGRIIDHLHHNISNGHVVHHIFFTQIPHYRLMAATEAIKPILGKHYRYDDTPIPLALLSTMRSCWFVDDIKDGVVTYKGAKEYQEWERQHAVQNLA